MVLAASKGVNLLKTPQFKWPQVSLWIFISSMVVACSSGPCHMASQSPLDEAKQRQLALEQGEVQMKDGVVYIKVYKYDGSKQCESGLAVSPEKMAEELDGIEILKVESLNDGLMRTQFCGNDTGQANVFTIAETDLVEALKKGYKKWTFGDFPQ